VGAEERARPTRVLAVDDVGALKQFKSASRDVAEIPERRRDEDELTSGDLTVLHHRLLVWLAGPAIN